MKRVRHAGKQELGESYHWYSLPFLLGKHNNDAESHVLIYIKRGAGCAGADPAEG
jgi:hypothetical protein